MLCLYALCVITIPSTNTQTIEVKQTIPQTSDYVQYDNEYVSYFEDSQLVRIHMNDKTQLYLGNADKYTKIKVEKKIYTNLLGKIVVEDVQSIDLD